MIPARLPSRPAVAVNCGRLGAFARRDLQVAWSYRTAFLGDMLNLAVQITMFSFVARMIDPSVIPSFGGRQTGYLEFVTVGIALGAFLQLGLSRVSTAIRQEQYMGTLEPLLMTASPKWVIQLGLASYDLIYIPLRTAVFLAAVAGILGVDFETRGMAGALIAIGAFIPFVWGLGMVGAAAILTFKRGGSLLGISTLAINISSGAYFPLDLFPGWVQTIARYNPVAVAFHATREALLGGGGVEAVLPHLPLLAASAVVSLVVGTVAVEAALRRELGRGSLGMY